MHNDQLGAYPRTQIGFTFENQVIHHIDRIKEKTIDHLDKSRKGHLTKLKTHS